MIQYNKQDVPNGVLSNLQTLNVKSVSISMLVINIYSDIVMQLLSAIFLYLISKSPSHYFILTI